jgi:hypothetical protein
VSAAACLAVREKRTAGCEVPSAEEVVVVAAEAPPMRLGSARILQEVNIHEPRPDAAGTHLRPERTDSSAFLKPDTSET